MARHRREIESAVATTPPAGTARACVLYRGEMARHRIITADALDYVVATTQPTRGDQGYVTAAYPVARGYLVMLRQPLCALRSEDAAGARAQHTQLVRVLAELGTAVVRARRRSAAWRKAERQVEAGTSPLAAAPHLDAGDLVALAGAASAV